MDSSLFHATSYALLLYFSSLFHQPPRDPSSSPESLSLESLSEIFHHHKRIPTSPNTVNAQTTMGTTFDYPGPSFSLCTCEGTQLWLSVDKAVEEGTPFSVIIPLLGLIPTGHVAAVNSVQFPKQLVKPRHLTP